MELEINITNNHYEQFVGCYAKRFYSPFSKKSMNKIEGFFMKDGVAHFRCENNIEWDVEDCIIIADLNPISDDIRVADVKDENYHGWNPYTNTIKP